MHNFLKSSKDKPEFDSRVKNLIQIEVWLALLSKITGLLVFSLILIALFGMVVKAAGTDSLFIVPMVRLTNTGAEVIQPQLKSNNTGLENRITDHVLADGFSSYRPPLYDAFSANSMNMTVNIPEPKINTAQQVDILIANNMPGASDGSMGTTKTIFNFSAQVQSNSLTDNSGFQYRWDFENDGKIDKYFSVVPNTRHQFKKAGQYNVKLQVLDKAGRVSQVNKLVVVALNDAPSAVFSSNKDSAPVNSIISFDTSLSSDNQYNKNALSYRFDWDSDGKWDTNFQNKISWNHMYREAGNFEVTMETMDPEGASSKAALYVEILSDEAPLARMSVKKVASFNGKEIIYQFDASSSSDDHSRLQNLRFRWDFNFNGPNDIVFDTAWGSSPKYTGSYHLSGDKTIRLQVMDEQGRVSETFARV